MFQYVIFTLSPSQSDNWWELNRRSKTLNAFCLTNDIKNLQNLCIHKAFEKHTLLEFAHHLHMLPIPFFQYMCYNKFMFHSPKLVPWHVFCQPYLSLHTWKHLLSIETHPFCYTPIPPYYPKSQRPWFLGPSSVQFPRLNRPKSTQKHQQHF